jgi:hypothetical protein
VFQRGLIPFAPGSKQLGDVVRRSWSGGHGTQWGGEGQPNEDSVPQLRSASKWPLLETFASALRNFVARPCQFSAALSAISNRTDFAHGRAPEIVGNRIR